MEQNGLSRIRLGLPQQPFPLHSRDGVDWSGVARTQLPAVGGLHQCTEDMRNISNTPGTPGPTIP